MHCQDDRGSSYFLYYDMDGGMIFRKHSEYQQKVLAKASQDKKAIAVRPSPAKPVLSRPPAAPPPKLASKSPPATSLSEARPMVIFRKGPPRPDDIAVIIRNADYTKQSGEADTKPYGNGDGEVAYDELDRYLKGTMTYYARRYHGRDQTAQIVVGGGG